jgi:hypothetical protein
LHMLAGGVLDEADELLQALVEERVEIVGL